jgi:pullulanase
LIKEFLSNGIGVIMDVVYNHVPAAQNHPLGVSVPGYYFRTASFSGAGDDTASEREMFRRYMISSLSWWLSEYKLSGFRFDLMGLHDVETMNAIATALRKIKSDVILYGEGWDMYRAGKMVPASMLEARKLPDFGFFNDAFRCGIKGSAFNPYAAGFVHDGSHLESVKFGIVGSVYHHQVHNRRVDGTANPNPWSDRTAVSVNYTEIHDNSTLYDKLVLVESVKSEAWYERLQKMAIGLVLLSQGMPVLHAGMEFMRTKEISSSILAANPDLHDLYWTQDGKRAFSHNTYNLGDVINGLDWMRCSEKQNLVSYVHKLIEIRKKHPLFRLQSAPEVVLSISFFELCPQVLCWVVDGCATVDSWSSVCVLVNTSSVPIRLRIPDCVNGGMWHLVTDGNYFMDDVSAPAAAFDPSSVPASAVPGAIGNGESGQQTIAAKALYLYAEF